MPKPAEQMGPPKSGNSKCQILDSRAWAPELPNLLNSWDPQKLETPEASKQLCFFWVAVYKGSSFPLLLGGGSPQATACKHAGADSQIELGYVAEGQVYFAQGPGPVQ